jgi:hypothetical protein
MKKRILAIPAAAAAIPMKPKIAATNANMKNARAQRSISPPRKNILAFWYLPAELGFVSV